MCQRTIWSLTVLPSRSMVRIFYQNRLARAGNLLEARATYKVDTDGGDVGFRVGVVGETQQQARLSYTGVTDEEELEEVVVSERPLAFRASSIILGVFDMPHRPTWSDSGPFVDKRGKSGYSGNVG